MRSYRWSVQESTIPAPDWWEFGRSLGFLDLADLSAYPRGISECCGFPVCWPFARP